MIFKCYSSEELITLNTLHEVVPTWYTEAMRIKSLAQGENILMLGFEPSTFCIQNRHSNHYTNCSQFCLIQAVELPFSGIETITLFLQSSGIVFSLFKALEWRFSMSVTSPSNSGIFRTRFGISSRPGDVSLRDVRSAARISVVVNGADS